MRTETQEDADDLNVKIVEYVAPMVKEAEVDDSIDTFYAEPEFVVNDKVYVEQYVINVSDCKLYVEKNGTVIVEPYDFVYPPNMDPHTSATTRSSGIQTLIDTTIIQTLIGTLVCIALSAIKCVQEPVATAVASLLLGNCW